MRFKSHQVKGKGRGKLLGFPTINLEIPEDFDLKDGIYSVKVFINGQEFLGAMHYGPIPVFNESSKTLEIFIIDIKPEDLPETHDTDIEVEVGQYLREVMNFSTEQELAKQIGVDVENTRKAFS